MTLSGQPLVKYVLKNPNAEKKEQGPESPLPLNKEIIARCLQNLAAESLYYKHLSSLWKILKCCTEVEQKETKHSLSDCAYFTGEWQLCGIHSFQRMTPSLCNVVGLLRSQSSPE